MPHATRSRRSLFLLALLSTAALLTPLRPARAQDGERTREAPYRAGASALEFAVGPNFTLSSFSGGTLSYRRHVSESAAWRIGMTLNARSGDSDRDLRSPDTLSSPPLTQEREFGTLGVAVTAQRLWFAGGSSPVHVYVGLGPSAGVFRDDSDLHGETRLTDTTVVETIHAERRDWFVGVAGVLGVEWFMTRSLSLVADYGASVDWQSFSRSTTRTGGASTQQDDEDGHVFGISSNGVHFGVAAWFR